MKKVNHLICCKGCYNLGYKNGKEYMRAVNQSDELNLTKAFNRGKEQNIEDIKIARQCMRYLNLRCDNKDCINKSCPLNEYWNTETQPKE